MSVVGLIGTAVSLVGTVVQAGAQQKMVNEQTAASKRAENNREQQMQLDSQRRRRQAVREAIMARSMSLTVGTSQGAQYGTGVAAGMSGATAQGLENQQGVNSAEILGSRIFAANRDYFDATQRGQAGMALGAGISSIGGAIVSNAGAITRLGGGFGQGGGQTDAVGQYGIPPLPRPRPNR